MLEGKGGVWVSLFAPGKWFFKICVYSYPWHSDLYTNPVWVLLMPIRIPKPMSPCQHRTNWVSGHKNLRGTYWMVMISSVRACLREQLAFLDDLSSNSSLTPVTVRHFRYYFFSHKPKTNPKTDFFHGTWLKCCPLRDASMDWYIYWASRTSLPFMFNPNFLTVRT